MLKLSQRTGRLIASPIRKFLPLVQRAEARGIEVLKLSSGDPDLAPPEVLLKKIKSYPGPNIPYAPSPGIPEHVNAWLAYYKSFGVRLKPENIIPTVGCAEAIQIALTGMKCWFLNRFTLLTRVSP